MELSSATTLNLLEKSSASPRTILKISQVDTQTAVFVFHHPNLPILAFWDFLAFFHLQGIPCFLERFPLLSQEFRGSEERKMLAFLVVLRGLRFGSRHRTPKHQFFWFFWVNTADFGFSCLGTKYFLRCSSQKVGSQHEVCTVKEKTKSSLISKEKVTTPPPVYGQNGAPLSFFLCFAC